MNKEPKNKKFNVKDYKDSSGPSLKMMSVGLWLSENRRRLLKIFIAFLLISIIGFFVYSTYGYLYYLLVGKNQDISLTENFAEMGIDIQAAHLRSIATPLSASAPIFFKHNDTVDLAVFLKNSNERYFASLNYCFVSGGEEFACGTDFVMPNSEKYLLALNQEGKNGNYSFIIKNTSWNKIDNRKYPNWPEYYKTNVNFQITNKKISSEKGMNNLSFLIENKSPYSYWEVPLNIVLTRGGSVVGVNRFVLSNLKSLENRAVDIAWNNGNLSGVNIEIMPDVNILDESIYRIH